MLQNLQEVMQMCARAQQFYGQAMAFEVQAGYDNNAAQGMAWFDGGGDHNNV